MAWVGTSGWSYDHWEDVLYPPGLAVDGEAGLLRGPFRTVELNASFYRWPRDATFANWRRRLPDGFRLSVKAPRGLTHGKRLYAPEDWIGPDRPLLARTRCDRRGMLLVQLHPGSAARRRPAGLLPVRLSRLAPRRRGVPPSQLGRRRPCSTCWIARRGVLHHERRRAARASCAPPRRTSISGCTAPTTTSCTAGPTAMTTCAGGRTGSGSGRPPAATCTRTSTTTAAATPSATPVASRSCQREKRP